MSHPPNDFRRFFRYFFYASLAIIAFQYIKWFLIDPFVPPGGRSSNWNFQIGIFFLLVYGASFFLSQILSGRFFFFTAVLALAVNIAYLSDRMPSLEASFRCQGAQYYVAEIHYIDYFDTEMTKWSGGLRFETHYVPSRRIYEIVCDEHEAEINFIGNDELLFYSEGELTHTFYYDTAQLGNNRYFLEEVYTCDSGCKVSSYRLYQCNLDFTACNPLPISYTEAPEGGADAIYGLKADVVTGTVSLYQWFQADNDEKLIFSFGEEMHCYAEGCVIDGT